MLSPLPNTLYLSIYILSNMSYSIDDMNDGYLCPPEHPYPRIDRSTMSNMSVPPVFGIHGLRLTFFLSQIQRESNINIRHKLWQKRTHTRTEAQTQAHEY